MTPQWDFYLVDAFTNAPFQGNQAAVYILGSFPADHVLQALANEHNVAETAFCVPEGRSYRLRWFTPFHEVDLCGHATLATGHVLIEQKRAEVAEFSTRSGRLEVRPAHNMLRMELPAHPPQPTEAPAAVWQALGMASPPEGYEFYGGYFNLLVLPEPRLVRGLTPDFLTLKGMPLQGGGLVVTSRADQPQWDFVSRFFAPALGINEDYATGSAHCMLFPYWTEKLQKPRLTGCQVSARPGLITGEWLGPQVALYSHAVTVAKGTLLVTP